MAKKKPLKKDRKAGSRPANAGPKKPFYQEIGAKRPQKKKPHPFGKGWELAEDFDRLEEGEYEARCTALDEDGNGIVQIEGVPFAVGGLLPGEEGTVAVSGRKSSARSLCGWTKLYPSGSSRAARSLADAAAAGCSTSPMTGSLSSNSARWSS